MTNILKLPEFSWHLSFPYSMSIERDRPLQTFNNCWAVALASVIVDNLCISENIQPIYPSSIWLTALNNDFIGAIEKQKTMLNPGIINFGDFLNYLKSDCYVSLDSCFPEISTVNFLSAKDFAIRKVKGIIPENTEYDRNWSRGYYTKISTDIIPKCCKKCQKLLVDSKNIDKLMDNCDKIKEDCVNDEEYIFKIHISDVYSEKKVFKDDVFSKIDLHYLRKVQQFIKTKLCKGPILGIILSTPEYKSYARSYIENLDKNLSVFTQLLPRDVNYTYKFTHTITILGWGLDETSNKYFWWIRDPNVKSYLKIAFNDMNMIRNRSSIGPDMYFVYAEPKVLYCGIHIYAITPAPLDPKVKDTYIKNGLLTLIPKTVEEFDIM